MSLEAIPQEVSCANNTTLNSVVELKSVLCQVCANLENIFKIRWDQEEVFLFVSFMQHQGYQRKACRINCTQIWKIFAELTEFGRRCFSCATDTH